MAKVPTHSLISHVTQWSITAVVSSSAARPHAKELLHSLCTGNGFPPPGSAGRDLQRGQVQRAAAAGVAGLYVGARGEQLAQDVQAAGAHQLFTALPCRSCELHHTLQHQRGC